MKSLLCSLAISASLLATSAHAALDIQITAPNKESTLLDISIRGSFKPASDITRRTLPITVLGNPFDADLRRGIFDDPIELFGRGIADLSFDGLVFLDAGFTRDTLGFVMNTPTNFREGLTYRVNGTSTFDISRSGAMFADLNPGTYTLRRNSIFTDGGTLTIGLQPIPEPAAGVFAAISVFGFILIRRRMRAKAA